MKDSLQTLCRQFIENRETVKNVLRWENSHIYPICANIFCSRGVMASEEKLLACKQLIKDQTGVFSNFRGTIRPPVISMLSLDDQPAMRLSQALDNYSALKGHFWGSEYLALVAFQLTELTDSSLTVEEKAARGKALYQRMRKEHPLLTSSEDSVFAVLLAFSDKDDDALIDDMEACFRLLKERFFDGNSVQSASHVLAMAEGTAAEKTDRMLRLYDAIRAAGGKYSRSYGLAPLAALSILDVDIPTVTADMMDVDAFLAQQKGYGFWGLDKRTRLTHAAMIVSDEYTARKPMETASIASAMALIAAQQMAVLAGITATAAVTSSSGTH